MNIKEIDLTNKVVLDLKDYIELREELTKLRMAYITRDDKYHDLLKYLISECQVKKYTSGKKYLEYDGYNNHLVDYIKEIEPELYEQKLEEKEVE